MKRSECITMLSEKQRQGAGRITALLSLWIIFTAAPARAVQLHGGSEGLVVHQLGHILFAGGMLFLLIVGHLNNWRGAGWDRFRCFLSLTVFWNVLTFTGHWLRHAVVADEKFVRVGGKVVGLHIESAHDIVFYLASLDHLVLVPALLCLAVALRQWKQASEDER